MPDVDQLSTDTREALQRVIRDHKAKPADVVKAAELLRTLGGSAEGADMLELDDADLLRIARGSALVTEGGAPRNEGPAAAPSSRVPSDAVGTPWGPSFSGGPKGDPSDSGSPATANPRRLRAKCVVPCMPHRGFCEGCGPAIDPLS